MSSTNDSPRADAILKVTGKAKYAAEHPVANVCYGVFVSSTIASGIITNLDDSLAIKSEGVLDVISFKNCPSIPGYASETADGKRNPQQWWGMKVLYDNIVRFHGQPIALVVADSFENANAAVNLVKVNYDVTSFETNFTAARNDNANLKSAGTYKRGDLELLQQAPYKVEGEFTIPIEVHNPMEMHASIALWEGDDKLTVYDKSQGPKSTQGALSRLFGLPEKQVRVIVDFVGGAFGNALRSWHNLPAACIAAKKIKRPVKVVLTRQQMFSMVGYRPASWQKIRLGADLTGKFVGIEHAAISNTSRYEEFREGIVNVSRFLYACDNVATDYKLLPLDLSTPTWKRGPGEATGCFALESAIDELSYQLKMDPVDLRLVNEPAINPESKMPWSSRYLRECYEKGKEMINWSKRPQVPGTLKENGMLIGYGMSTGVFGASKGAASVRAILTADGQLELQSAVSDMGPGTTTAMIKIAAENLQIPTQYIRFKLGDSDLPPGPTQGGSTTTSTLGSAVHLACETLKKNIKQLAKQYIMELKDVDENELAYAKGELSSSTHAQFKMPIAQLLTLAKQEQLNILVSSTGNSSKQIKYATNSFSAHFVKVQVNPKTMEVQILEAVTTADAGKIISENTARSQMIGGVVGGVGMALKEELLFDHKTGQIRNASFAGYKVPLHTDIPTTKVWFVNKPDPIINPIGAKGLGEIAFIGFAAAVANAVYNATGKRIRSLPITPAKLGAKTKT